MKTIDLGEIRIAVRDEGSGPPLLLVHGFPLDGTMWSPLVDQLAGEFRLIVPDLRGFGQSSGADSEITMQQLADDLAALLDALAVTEPVAFCGLSMGGYVAWQFWRRHPQRLGRLILCDTRAAGDSAEARENRLKMAEHVVRRGTEFVAEAMLPKIFAPASLSEQPELVSIVQQTILRTDPRAIAGAQRGMAARPDVTAWLGEIDVPALVVVGEHDTLSPVGEMREIAAALPQAELIVVPGAGHMAPLENSQLVGEEIARFCKPGG